VALGSRCSLLDVEVAPHFVAAAIRVAHVGCVVLAGVYIPPANSRFVATSYSVSLDALAESVAVLCLRHSIPREGVLLLGDFNAHVGHLDCGRPLLSAPLAGPAVPHGYYGTTHYTECQGRSATLRGESLNRACQRHAWLLLNGRAPSDMLGRATC